MSNLNISANRNLETADFTLILRIAQNTNLSRAAQELGVSLSTVSRQLQTMEARLGQALIRRGKRSTELTAAGTLLAQHAQEILDRLSEIEQALNGAQKANVLRMQSTFGFGRQILAPIITQFCRLHPDQKIQLDLADRDPDLLDDRFDLAIRFGQPPDRAVVARKLAPNRRFLVASPDYARVIGKFLKTPQQLPQIRSIALNQDNDRFSIWQLINTETKAKERVSIRVAPVLASNHGEVVKQWATDGLGVALRSEFDVAPELKTGTLVRILKDWEGVPSDIYAMYRPRKSGLGHPQQTIGANFLTFLQISLRDKLNRM
jgi:LysR family transcriptional regulator, transcriptional activator for dmlA